MSKTKALAVVDVDAALEPIVDRPEGERDLKTKRAEAVGSYLASLRTESSRLTMISALKTIVMTLQSRADIKSYKWEELTAGRIEGILSRLQSKQGRPGLDALSNWIALPPLGAASVNKHLAAIKGVMKRCRRERIVDADTYMDIKELTPVEGSRLLRGRALSKDERVALVAQCDLSTAYGARSAALLSLLYACGLRRAEAVGMEMDDFDPQTRMIKVIGKRNKEREVPVNKGALAALENWFRFRGQQPGPVFLAMTPKQTIRKDMAKISGTAVWKILRSAAEGARLRKECSPHDMRRSLISDMLDNGTDLVTVQKFVGHARPETTARYDRRGVATMQKAAEKLDVPFPDR